MSRTEELLSVNKQWAIGELIKLLAYVYKINDYDNLLFDDLETLVVIHSEKEEDKK